MTPLSHPGQSLSLSFQTSLNPVTFDFPIEIPLYNREDSVALKYTDLVTAKRPERSAWVKSKNVVYIYHDAIEELKNLVRIITSDFGGTNIMITADHGFLYTYSPLTEDDKADKADNKHYVLPH